MGLDGGNMTDATAVAVRTPTNHRIFRQEYDGRRRRRLVGRVPRGYR